MGTLWLAPIEAGTAASVTVEAESGMLGAGFATGSEGGVGFIQNTSNNTDTGSPLAADRVASYSVTFPGPGTYHLYARVRVGPEGADDDSFFYGNGFGMKSAANGDDWRRANSLSGYGFVDPGSIVSGGGPGADGAWVWLDFSDFTGGAGDAPVAFEVPAGALTQSFEIGGREDGFSIDKFVFGSGDHIFTVAELDAGGPGVPPPPPPYPPDRVAGDLIQFNDNGAWCWYQDERVIHDAGAGRLITGSVASGAGTGGGTRDSDVEALVFDLASRTTRRSFLHSYPYCDDHNAPAFLRFPDGRVVAQYAGHNNDHLSRFRTLGGDTWAPESVFDWTSVGAGGGEETSYSNPYFLSAEGRAYTFVRCIDNRSPNFLVSDDMGATWSYGGQLVEPDGAVGYNSGYFRYSGNGIDRIDFICTEGHPRDLPTSIYHGYIQGGKSHRSDGTVVDGNILDAICPVSSDFTPVFLHGTELPSGKVNTRCWNSDVRRYADGTVQAIIHARNDGAEGGDSGINPNHSFFFCRFDGAEWTTTYLCQAGTKMYDSEADYVGLGAMSPDDPDTIFISTRYDPRLVVPGEPDNSLPSSPKREIWKGVTLDGGATFRWTPVTTHSTRDNFRPVVPVWDEDNVAVLWFRGTYNAAQSFDASIVGLVERRAEARGPMAYVDATVDNTSLADGSPLETGAALGQWHRREGIGNGGDVLASADLVAEDAPALVTTVDVPGPGSYEVWVNFWGDAADGDWRVRAGQAADRTEVFRQMACPSVETGAHSRTLVLDDGGSRFLYQAYLGRMTAGAEATLEVFVDDHPVPTGSTGTLAADGVRTWFDGVSYARVGDPEPFRVVEFARSGPGAVTLGWTSLPPESLLAPQTFTVHKSADLSEDGWVPVATGIASEGAVTHFTDDSATDSASFYRISTP